MIPINEPYLPRHLTPLSMPPPRLGTLPPAREFLLNTTRADDPNYFFSKEYEDCWRPLLKDLVLGRFGIQADRACAAYRLDDPIVAIKDPNGSHGAELLMSLFPKSRMLALMRDGRDVVQSLLESRLPGGWRDGLGPPIENRERRMEFIIAQSRLWVQRTRAVIAAFEAHDRTRRLMLRYEELVNDPAAGTNRVLDWLGVQRSQQLTRSAIDATAADAPAVPSGRWQASMSERERNVMCELLGATLKELDYPVGAVTIL